MKRIRLGILIFIPILIVVAIIYGISEHQNKQAAGSLGMDYVRREYAERDSLKVAAICKPLFGGSGYQVVLKDSHEEAYYVIIVLGTERNLITVDDLTEDVRQGTSIFSCRP